MSAPQAFRDLTGRVCVVTGATRGIGRATVDRLAGLGARLVLLSRRQEDGQRVADELTATHPAAPPPDVITVDLSAQQSIREAAATVRSRYPRVHVLINNAGVIPRQRLVTVDGLEMQFAVNHLAYFLLTGLLHEPLVAGAPSRVINVSSGAHQGGTIDFTDLQSERRYDSVRVYGRTKLANVLFTYQLARRLGSAGVTANCLHPGVIATRLLADYMNVPMVDGAIATTLGADPAVGADTIVYLAASTEVEGVTGRYFVGRQETRSSAASYDEAVQRRLWEESERLTGLSVTAPP
ncbi:MAG TPA: SDR family oxidoreductase [Gemmatimonadales bacterium]|nr:SDR family oxidoreductase [Gemmatimonadales bacterium]